MDKRDGMIGVVALLVGGLGIKLIKERRYRNYLVNKFGDRNAESFSAESYDFKSWNDVKEMADAKCPFCFRQQMRLNDFDGYKHSIYNEANAGEDWVLECAGCGAEWSQMGDCTLEREDLLNAESFEATQKAKRKCTHCGKEGHTQKTCENKIIPFSIGSFWIEEFSDGAQKGFPLVDNSHVTMITPYVHGKPLQEKNSVNLPTLVLPDKLPDMTWGELKQKMKDEEIKGGLVAVGNSHYSIPFLDKIFRYLPTSTVLSMSNGTHYPIDIRFNYKGQDYGVLLAPRGDDDSYDAESFSADSISICGICSVAGHPHCGQTTGCPCCEIRVKKESQRPTCGDCGELKSSTPQEYNRWTCWPCVDRAGGSYHGTECYCSQCMSYENYAESFSAEGDEDYEEWIKENFESIGDNNYVCNMCKKYGGFREIVDKKDLHTHMDEDIEAYSDDKPEHMTTDDLNELYSPAFHPDDTTDDRYYFQAESFSADSSLIHDYEGQINALEIARRQVYDALSHYQRIVTEEWFIQSGNSRRYFKIITLLTAEISKAKESQRLTLGIPPTENKKPFIVYGEYKNGQRIKLGESATARGAERIVKNKENAGILNFDKYESYGYENANNLYFNEGAYEAESVSEIDITYICSVCGADSNSTDPNFLARLEECAKKCGERHLFSNDEDDEFSAESFAADSEGCSECLFKGDGDDREYIYGPMIWRGGRHGYLHIPNANYCYICGAKIEKPQTGWAAESHAYSYAYNEGHSDSRKREEYRPNLSSARQEGDFKKILKQKGD